MEQAMWLARVVLLAGGGALTARGIGDAPMWEAITGGILSAGAAVWSYYARKQALATLPPDAAAQVQAANTIIRETVGRR